VNRLLDALLATQALDIAATEQTVIDDLDEALTTSTGAALDRLLDDLRPCPNFAGSALFDRHVHRFNFATRAALWEEGAATPEQAERHLVTETAPTVRAAIAMTKGLDRDLVSRVLMDPAVRDNRQAWRYVMKKAGSDRSGLSAETVLSYALYPTERTVAGRDLIHAAAKANAAFAAAALTCRSAPPELRLAALLCPEVPPQAVMAALAALAEEPAPTTGLGDVADALACRPVVTPDMLEAFHTLARVWAPSSKNADVNYFDVTLEVRRGWDLSPEEFNDRVRAAASTAELLELVKLPTPHVYDSTGHGVRFYVCQSPHATAEVISYLVRHKQVPVETAVMRWEATETVWDEPQMLAALLKTRPGVVSLPAEQMDEPTRMWADVLRGPGAAAFTSRMAADPIAVPSALWRAPVPWAGDVEALALGLPVAHVGRLTSQTLVTAVMAVITRHDTAAGTLNALVSTALSAASAGSSTPGLTLGDLVAAHAAATGQ
jgi:hypothetical protein